MKAIRFIAAGFACTALTTTAFGATSQTRSCIDSFIAQELDTRATNVTIREEYLPPMPLILRTEIPMQLTAVEKKTGRTIATASCDPQRGLVEVRKHEHEHEQE